MGVDGISAGLGAPTTGIKGSGFSGANLTMSDFFQLIAAQLQNQSMYDTVDNAEFMSQMVQFSTLSQMEELSSAFQSNLAVSMIGKNVNVSTQNDLGVPLTVQGVVSEISYSSGTPLLKVNGAYYKIAEVTDVGIDKSAGAAEG